KTDVSWSHWTLSGNACRRTTSIPCYLALGPSDVSSEYLGVPLRSHRAPWNLFRSSSGDPRPRLELRRSRRGSSGTFFLISRVHVFSKRIGPLPLDFELDCARMQPT